MHYIYGDFSNAQMKQTAKVMHNEIHKLLLYVDKKFITEEEIFDSREDFYTYFENIMIKYGGLNKLLGEPNLMVAFMSTLQSAYEESKSENFRFKVFRKLIFDAHGYLDSMFEEVQ